MVKNHDRNLLKLIKNNLGHLQLKGKNINKLVPYKKTKPDFPCLENINFC